MAARVAYLVSEYPAPSHTFIRREVAALREAGVDVLTFSIRPSSRALESAWDRAAAETTFVVLDQSALTFLRAHLVAAVTSPVRYLATLLLAFRHRVPGARAAMWSLFHFAEAIVLARRLQKDRVTRLHNHFANAGATVGLLASSYAGLPWSLTLHGTSELDYPAGPLLAAKIAAADFTACASRFLMAQAMRLTAPSLWGRLVLVRCGLDLSTLPSARQEFDGTDVQLIAVGRLSPEKAHLGLIDALALLRKRGVAVRLILVGEGPEESAIRAHVELLALTSRVQFTGRLDERTTLDHIAQADILVLPSFMEGLPIVLMEAMAIGVPVVATRVAGIPELVRDEQDGLLVDPADWAGFADAIERLATDGSLRSQIIAAGREKINEEFVINRAVLPLIARFKTKCKN